MRYQELVQFGTVQRRVEHLAQDLADFAERLNATICKLAGPSGTPILRSGRATGRIDEFWDQFERDVDRQLAALRSSGPRSITGYLQVELRGAGRSSSHLGREADGC